MALRKKIKAGGFDLVHAHYGLSGLLAVLQRIIPVVITFHGSDVNVKSNVIFSRIASQLSVFNIFVNESMPKKLKSKDKLAVIPCGVDLDVFFPMSQQEAREKLNFNKDKCYILFTSAFSNTVKNYPLAKATVDKLQGNVQLVELKNKNRSEVNVLLNACDLLLMTSFSEGSPQIIKEALATNTPIVSTNVGDVDMLLKGVKNTHIVNFDKNEVLNAVNKVLENKERTNGRKLINRFDLKVITLKLLDVYEKACKS